jgi:glutathione synthase
MFLVGLDIVADKLIEINVFSPGGLGSSSEFAGVDFAQVVIEDIERKVEFRKDHDGKMRNSELATM